jgi:hypothetical protein
MSIIRCDRPSNRHNFRKLNTDLFRSKLLMKDVHLNPKKSANEFATQLRDVVLAVLDESAPQKLITGRHVQHADSWLSREAGDARRMRRQLERRYRRTQSEQD